MPCLRGFFRGLLLLDALVPLRLAMALGAIGTWFGIQGGSIMYRPIGLVILLARLAIPRSHSITGLFLLALLVFPMITRSIGGIDARIRVLSSVVQLSRRINLLLGLLGLLVMMELTFFVVCWCRILAGSRLVPAASSRASVTPGWIKANDGATRLQREDP